MARSCIEVGYRAGNEDPILHFAYQLKNKYGGTKEVEDYNYRLLENLIQKNQISRSSIIWHQDRITKIYGFKIDSDGKIEYDLIGSHSPDRKAKKYVTNAPRIDMSAVRNAIIRTKQTS